MNDKVNLTKEQRAHDITLQLLKHSLKNEDSTHLNKAQIFELVKYYENAYSAVFKSFESSF